MLNPVDGTRRGETLIGTDARDKISAGKGADILNGGKRADILLGQGGNDTFVLSFGSDRIKGGAGLDSIDASGWKFGVYVNLFSFGYTDYSSSSPTSGLKVAGGTLKLGGPGAHEDWTVQSVVSVEHFIGSRHDDLFRAASASGTIRMGKGNDEVSLLEGFATLIGGLGNDDLGLGKGGKAIGGAGDDTLSGGDRSTVGVLLGGKGNDLIFTTAQDIAKGGPGRDRIVVTESNTNTKLFGGSGADTFDFGYYQSGAIEDFQPGRDKVDITAHVDKTDATWADLSTMFAPGERGVRLTFDFDTGLRGQYVEFVGLSVSDISQNDFILFE